MEKKVILFNGPPGSGKDTGAVIARNYLATKNTIYDPFKPRILKFADPLKTAAHALYGIPYSTEYYEKEFGHDWKNQPQQEFFGDTPRQVYIALSEEFAKRTTGGEEFFGRIAARRVGLDRASNYFIFSDSGFATESRPLIKLLGAANVFVFQVERKGCDYSNDSRSNIAPELVEQYPAIEKNIHIIPNHQDLSVYRLLIHGTIDRCFGE